MDTRIKNYLGASLIFGVLVFSLAAWNFAHSVEPDSFRSFNVSGEGKSVAIPDVAQFTLGVITEGGLDLNQLQKDNVEKANVIIEYLKDQGIDKEDIRTTAFNVSPRRQSIRCFSAPCPEPDITGYRVSQSVTVKVRDDFEKAGSLLSGVVERGANSVSQLFFTVDDPTEVENEARKRAFEAAKEKAELTAKAGGFKLGKLISVSEGGGFFPVHSRAFDESAGFGGGIPDVQLEPGSQEITVTVNLEYEIR